VSQFNINHTVLADIVSSNRELAKRMWLPTSSDEDEDDTELLTPTPTLVPVSQASFTIKPSLLDPNVVEPTIDDCEWATWSAPHRMIALHQWKSNVEQKWGTINHWPAQLVDEWKTIQDEGVDEVVEWFALAEKKATTGRRLLSYLVRIVDGELPTDIEEWRVLYIQGLQLACNLHSGIIGLEYQLHAVQMEYYSERECSPAGIT
jgi:hypothetical protein